MTVERLRVGQRRAATRRAAKAAAPASVALVARPAEPATDLAVEKKKLRITDAVLRRAREMTKRRATGCAIDVFKPYEPPPGVLPQGTKPIAMDEALVAGTTTSFNGLMAWGTTDNGLYEEGIGFLGYAYLAQLTQRPEYRRISERIATEMTRKWIKLNVVSATTEQTGEPAAQLAEENAGADPLDDDEGEGPEAAAAVAAQKAEADRERVRTSVAAKTSAVKAKRVKELGDALRDFKIKDHFYNIAEGDGWFGRYHLFVDLKMRRGRATVAIDTTEGRDELKTSIGNGSNAVSRAKVRKGSIAAFRCVEPMWCYPASYDSANPLKEGFYNPVSWYVNGVETHRSRLMCFVGREVPDILKPAYAFGGLSMSQMAKPYVDNWLRTRQAVADLIESFSVNGVYTNMAATIQEGGLEALKRIELFSMMKSNSGVFALDKETEEFFNVSTPLGTLDDLQAQAQEQMSSVSGIPLVILLGITPKGLNASSEGEIRAFYDWIHAYQESFFRDNLQAVIHFIMLHLWGEIDEEITFEFEPLWSMTDKEKAEIDKLEAETDNLRIDGGVLDPGEVRKALATQPDSRYSDINPDDVPEPPEQPIDDAGDGGDDEAGGEAATESPADRPEGASDEWKEGDHPRADDGKFGSGAGGSASSKSPPGKKGTTGPASSQPGAAASSSKGTSPYKTAGKPSWNGGTHPDPTAMETAQLETGARTLQHAVKNSPFTAKQRAAREERLADLTAELQKRAGSSAGGKQLDVSKLKKEGGRLGTNEGGVYTNDAGGKFYIKKPPSKAHVANEMAAARLYQLAGVSTLKYRDAGAEHVATEWQDLDKNNISKFTPAEKKAAAADFAVHAWLSNWDAAGTGGDNQGMLAGKPVTLDVGGSLRFRAQGGPKGAAFGDKVTELDTLRDANIGPDAAALFGSMTDAQIKSSIERVTSIPDDKIRKAVGGDNELADRLIARKKHMAQRFGIALDADPDAAMMTAALEANSGVPIAATKDDDEDDDKEPVEISPGVFAMDEQQFDESKHKRDGDGKFSSTGGGGAAAKEEPAQVFKTKKEHIAHLLTNGTTPKDLMQAMGWPSVSMPAQAKSLGMKLEKKDGKYFGTKMTDAELKAAKEEAVGKQTDKDAQQVLKNAGIEPKGDLGAMAGQAAPKLNEAAPLSKEAATELITGVKDYAGFIDAIDKAAKLKDAKTVKMLTEFYPAWAEQFLTKASPAGKAALATVASSTPSTKPKASLTPATAAELEKAKKSTPLPLSSSDPDAADAIKAFNDKYAGKNNLTPAQLIQKVADHKAVLATVKQKESDAAAAAQAEAKKKEEAAAKKKASAEAKAQAELDAKFAADPELKTHYEAMKLLFGGGKASAKYIENAKHKVESAGLGKAIRAEDAVPIIAYSGSHYGKLNSQLRGGKMTKDQYAFSKSLNAGLDKLPAYNKTTYRKASLTPEQASLYEPGHIIEERGFTSTSKNASTWQGDHQFTIHGKNGRDISKLSSHPHEAEVLFRSGSRFEVVSKSGKNIVLKEV